MEDIFIKLLNMSITASYFVVALMLLRAIFRKIPKWINCALWGLVGLRLILPVSFESILSLVPSAETVPSDIMMSKSPYITSGIGIIDGAAEHILYRTVTPNPGDSVNPLQVITAIAAAIWLFGIAVMLIYTLISYILVKRKTSAKIRTEKDVYICDNIATPFILGVIKPKIFIPSFVDEENTKLILSHERAHIKRLDHIWKPLGFLILSVYWFNPLMWIAYILLCRDIEAACDEKVLKNGGTEIKKSYSEALINCSAPRHLITACPLAFGETGVKQRIKNILSYKKPTLWLIIIALIVSIILSVCFMTNPDGMRIDDITGFDGIFRNVEKVQLFTGTAYIFTTEDVKPELSEIKKVRIEKTPADISFEASYRIEIDDDITININESFTLLYLNNYINGTLRKSETYSIRNPEVLKDLFSENNYVTGMPGIYVTIDEVYVTESDFEIRAIWHNERNEDVEYGEMFTIERFTDEGLYKMVSFPENFVFLLPSYYLKGNSTAEKSYRCPMSLSDGEYRFTTTFRTENGESYSTKANFIIGESTSSTSDIGGTSGPQSVTTTRALTIDDVIRLSEKGEELTWSDFDEFTHVETGSGLYIRIYEIDGRFSLTIGGSGTDRKPMYIYLSTYSDHIDIRGDDVESFIEEHKSAPFPDPELNFGLRAFPVDSTGDNYNEIVKYGAYLPRAYGKWKTYPTVRIDSFESFERFYEHFESRMDYSLMYEDTAFPFNQSKDMYGKEISPDFFDERCLLIIYVAADDSSTRLTVSNLQVFDDMLYINICESVYKDAEKSSPAGWLILVEAYKAHLTKIKRIEAYLGATIELPEPEITHTYTQLSPTESMVDRCLHLYDDGTFALFVSPYSSFVEFGTFIYEGDLLILSSDDGERRYVFEVNSDHIVFRRNESVVYKFFTEEAVPDGTKFTLL